MGTRGQAECSAHVREGGAREVGLRTEAALGRRRALRNTSGCREGGEARRKAVLVEDAGRGPEANRGAEGARTRAG